MIASTITTTTCIDPQASPVVSSTDLADALKLDSVTTSDPSASHTGDEPPVNAPVADAADTPIEPSGDADVEALWLRGDSQALRVAYERFGSLIYTFCLRRLGKPELAGECTQDIFVSAWKSRSQYVDSRGRLIAWMMGIAKFRVVDTLRAQARHPVPYANPTGDQVISDADTDDVLANQLLIGHAIATLDERPRQVIELAYYSDLTHAEIVQRTGLPLGTVNSDIRRGLKRMRDFVEGVKTMANDAIEDDNPNEKSEDLQLGQLRGFAERHGRQQVQLESPPPGLWDRIEATLQAGATGEADATDENGVAASAPSPELVVGGLHPVAKGPMPATQKRPMVSNPGRFLIAAAIILVVAVGGFILSRQSPSEEVLATTDLEALSEVEPGAAELLVSEDTLQLRLSTGDFDVQDAFVEVWLINTDASELVSLGPLRSDGLYELPSGLNPEDFPIVDVSFEPFDGGPTHSGDSVLRGQLTF